MMASQRATTTSARRRQRAILIATVVGAASLDGVTKLAAEATLDDGPEHIVGPLALKLGHNAGVAFGLGATGPAWMVLAVTAVVIAVLAVAACCAEGVSRVSGAEELRVKETDRLAVMARQLGAMGAVIEEFADGMTIQGGVQRVQAVGEHDGRRRVCHEITLLALSGDDGA